MIKHLVLSLLLTLGLGASLSAQMADGKVRFGLKAGVVGANLYDDAIAEDRKSRVGFMGGAFAKLPLNKRGSISLRPELLGTSRGGKYSLADLPNQRPFVRTFHIDLPVSLEANILGFFNVHAGLHAAYLVSAKAEIDGGTVSVSRDNFEKLDYGWQLGGGLDFGNIGIHLRVLRGLNEISKDASVNDIFGQLKNSAWNLTLSAAF